MSIHTKRVDNVNQLPTDMNEPTDLFSWYKSPITNTIPLKRITIQQLYNTITTNEGLRERTEIHRRITDNRKARENKLQMFPYVTFNGIFKERGDEHIIGPSGFMVLDIDKQKDVKAISKRLATDTTLCPVLWFISPSGKGIKVVVRIDPRLIRWNAKSKKMLSYWTTINNYLSNYYKDIIIPDSKGNYIDESGTDLSRPCFICHDSECGFIETSIKVLGSDFVKEYTPASTKGYAIKNDNTKVSPKTTLNILQKRHCNTIDNHQPQLIKFIGAAMAIGENRETTLKYILDNIPISPESSQNDPGKLKYTVNDMYDRYQTDNREAEKLTEISFAYDIFLFRYSKDTDAYLLSGLCYEGTRQLLSNMGFFKRYLNPKSSTIIKEDRPIISEVSTEILRDAVTKYVDSISNGLSFTYQGKPYVIPAQALREIYLRQSNNIFNETWLEHMPEHTTPLLRDKPDVIYIPFKNKIVAINKVEITEKHLNELEDLSIWESQLIKRDFTYIRDSPANPNCHFAHFLHNVTNKDPLRFKALVTAIGYLMHHHFRPSEGEAVILYDEAITDVKKPMGGTGKGLIANALKEVRSVVKIDGKHFDMANRFRWERITPSSQVAWIDDVKPDFDFSILHSALTDGWTIERKHASQFFIESKDSPKTLICSNSILTSEGTTNSRRQLVYELSNYYSAKIGKGKKGPIEHEHGCLFFSEDWTTEEWNLFYSFMCDCALHYLNEGRVPHPEINVSANRLRQQTNEDFVSWAESKSFEVNVRYDTKQFFSEFIAIYYSQGHTIGQRTFTTWLGLFGDSIKWERITISSNNVQYFQFSARSG